MTHQQSSLKEIFNAADERLFCGRDAEVARFEHVLSSSNERTSIFAIYGIGGIGKSMLIRALARYAGSQGVVVAITSADNCASPIPILVELAGQLGKDKTAKRTFSGFNRDITQLRRMESQLRDRAHEDEKAVGKVVVEAAKGGVGSAAGVIVGSALAGPGGAVAGGIIGGALGPIVEGTSKALSKSFRGLPNNDVQFLSEADKRLTRSFLNAVNSLATDRRMAVFFDAIEYLGDTAKWLREDLLSGLGPAGIVVVLAGRYALPRDQWRDWASRLVEIELQPFSMQTTYNLLSRYGITEAEVMRLIFQQSVGLPLAIALWASYASQTMSPTDWQLSHPEIEASEVIETVTESLLRILPQERLREALRVCSVPRWFNLELLARLLKVDDAEQEYQALSGLQPAVRFRPRGLSLHDTIRDYLARSLSLRSPRCHQELHEIAKGYFEYLKRQLEAIGKTYDEQWQAVALEWIYHQLMLGDVSGFVAEIERSSRYYQHTFARTLIGDVETYRNAVEGISGVYSYHKGQNLIHHNDFRAAIEVFQSILGQPSGRPGDDAFASLVSYQLGKAYYWLGDIRNAELYLAQAMEYFESSNNSRMQSHAAAFLARIGEAKGQTRQAIHWRLYAAQCIKLLLRSPTSTDQCQRDCADRMFSLGEAARLRGSTETSRRIHLSCVEERRKLGNRFDIGESYLAVAQCSMALGRYDESADNLNKAMAIYEAAKDLYMLADIRLLFARLSLAKGDVAQAVKELETAVHMAEVSQHTRCSTEAGKLLSQVRTISERSG